MICGSMHGLTYAWSGGCPLSSMARLTTLPPSIRQNGGVSVHPPAMSMRTGDRPHTIWSLCTAICGCCLWAVASAVSPSRSSEKAQLAFSLATLSTPVLHLRAEHRVVDAAHQVRMLGQRIGQRQLALHKVVGSVEQVDLIEDAVGIVARQHWPVFRPETAALLRESLQVRLIGDLLRAQLPSRLIGLPSLSPTPPYPAGSAAAGPPPPSCERRETAPSAVPPLQKVS